jgi:hypothetical protein
MFEKERGIKSKALYNINLWIKDNDVPFIMKFIDLNDC